MARQPQTNCLDPFGKGSAKQPQVARVAYAPESLPDVFEGLVDIIRQYAHWHTMRSTSLKDSGYRLLKSRVRKLTRDSHGQREVEMPHPDQVDTVNSQDGLDVFHASGRFNQQAAHHAIVSHFRFVLDVTREEVIVGDREGGAASSL